MVNRWWATLLLSVVVVSQWAGVVSAQPLIQPLFRFADDRAPRSPTNIAAVSTGGALVLTPNGVARVRPDGSVGVVHTFADRFSPDAPSALLVPGGDGGYYSLTAAGGPNQAGTILRLDPTGRLDVVYAFRNAEDGGRPWVLVPGPGGSLYGLASGEQGATNRVFRVDATGAVTTGLADYSGTLMSVAPNGLLYGVISVCAPECGPIVVQRSLGGDETLIGRPLVDGLYSAALPQSDGGILSLVSRFDAPQSCDLVRIANGTSSILQTLEGGCGYRSLKVDGSGQIVGFTGRTVFRVTGVDQVSIIGRVSGQRLLVDVDRLADGRFWGVFVDGGSYNGGEVVDVAATSVSTVVAFWGGNADGAGPRGPIVRESDGYLYGVTARGGRFDRGTIYRVSAVGAATFQLLYTFSGGADGGDPSGLVRARDGGLYGTTTAGSAHRGTIFRVTRTGVLTTLHVFRQDRADGEFPGPLTLGRDGALYGRTLIGGQFGMGTAFRLTTSGTFTVLHDFGPTDGLPGSRLGTSAFLAASDGNLYGTTLVCELSNCGGATLFRMTPQGQVTLIWSTSGEEFRGPLLEVPGGRVVGSTPSGVFFLTPGQPAPLTIPPDISAAVVSAVAPGGLLFGYALRSGDSSDQVIKLNSTAPLRVVARSEAYRALPFSGTLTEGGDGFLYGTGESAFPDLGVVFRLPLEGDLRAPRNVRIVR